MFAITVPRFLTKCVVWKCNRFYGGKICSGSGKKGDSDKNKGEKSPCPDPSSNPSAASIYDCRKYGHNLPWDSVTPHFETLPYFPTGIFRCTTGEARVPSYEVLGQGANKGTCYQNPEYFSFHHMSFYDMHMLLRGYRKPSPKTGRKK